MAERGESLYGVFLVSVTVLIVGFLAGGTEDVRGTGRQSLIGVNANTVAMYSVCGFLVLTDALLNRRGVASRKLFRQMSIFGVIALALIISLTGSRTGVLILAAGLVVYFSTWSKMTLPQLFAVILAGLLSFGALWFIVSSDVIAARMLDVESDIRVTVLWPLGLQLLVEYPLFGSGLGYVESVILDRVGGPMALHNEYLKVATASGIVGLSLFILVLKRLLDSALIARRATGTGLQIALWTVLVLYLIPGGGALQSPFTWVLFLLLAAPPIYPGSVGERLVGNLRQ